MFINVRLGNNVNLVINPHCTVANLLRFFEVNLGRYGCEVKLESAGKRPVLDLSDELGRLTELHNHLLEDAAKFLVPNATYILVQRQIQNDADDQETVVYMPLLTDIVNLFPDYKLRVDGHKHGNTRDHAGRSNTSLKAYRRNRNEGERRGRPTSRSPKPLD